MPLHSATTQLPWSTLTARLLLADSAIKLADLNGTLAGVAIKGELGVAMTEPRRMNGDLTVAVVDLPTAIGATIGFPHQNGNGGAAGAWPADPFEAGLLGSLSGQITVKAGQVGLTAKLTAHDLRAVVNFGPSRFAVADIDGVLAGGRVGGEFDFARGDDGITTSSHFKFADVDAAELLGGGARAPLSGKLTVDLALAGSGRSPTALIGALDGQGTFALRDASIARLDPAAFDVVTRAVDQGLPIDPSRIGTRMEAALAARALPIAQAEGSIAVAMGQVRSVDPVTQGRRTGAGRQHRSHAERHRCALDPVGTEGRRRPQPAATRHLGQPEGPIDAPKRTLDVAALTNWLALRAVDQKAKRVDALEQAARERTTPGPAVRPTATRSVRRRRRHRAPRARVPSPVRSLVRHRSRRPSRACGRPRCWRRPWISARLRRPMVHVGSGPRG